MKSQVFQIEFGPYGNCWSACFASITGVPLAEIPNFNDEHVNEKTGERTRFWNTAKQREWMRERGYLEVYTIPPAVPACEAIAILPSPRGGNHAVVIDGGRVIHDPFRGATLAEAPVWIAFSTIIPLLR